MNKHIIICVGRQLGSGGHDIARMLALDFGAKYYDQELLNLAANESGFSEKFFEQNDEQRGLFRSLFNLHSSHVSDNSLYQNNFSQESLFKFQSDAILKLPTKARVSLWDAVPTMCCANGRTSSVCLSQPL